MALRLGRRSKTLLVGSAPTPQRVLEWFHALWLPLLEAYGVSENVVPIAMNRHDAFRLGSVGRPLLPNEVSLAEDREILVRGPGLAEGLRRQRIEERHRATIEALYERCASAERIEAIAR